MNVLHKPYRPVVIGPFELFVQQGLVKFRDGTVITPTVMHALDQAGVLCWDQVREALDALPAVERYTVGF